MLVRAVAMCIHAALALITAHEETQSVAGQFCNKLGEDWAVRLCRKASQCPV